MADYRPLVLGGPAGLAFQGGDGPNELPVKAAVSGQMVALSDGSRYFQDTGLTPEAITWSGTFEINGNYGTPSEKAAFVRQLRDSRTRTTLAFEGQAWGGFVQDATLTPIGAGRVTYSITFEVEVAGVLHGGLTATPTQSHADRATASLHQINQLAGTLSPTTQAANLAVQQARIAAGY